MKRGGTTDERGLPRMKKLPAGWEVRKLGEVCEIIGGGTPTKSKQIFYNGNILWATVRDMKEDVIKDTEHKITQAAVKNSATNIIPKGNVVIATRVGLGKICLLEKDTAINQDLKGILPINTKKLSVAFLYMWFKSIANKIVTEGTGATVQGVKLPFINSIQITYPPLPEQKRIVKILDRAFEAIGKAKANAEKNLRNSRELFESYLQGVFGNPGKDWEEKRFDEICTIKHGYPFEGKYFTNKGEFKLLTPGNFYEKGGFRDRGEKQKYFVGPIPPTYILKKGDLLVAMTEQAAGLLGSPIIIPRSDTFLHNQRLGLVTQKQGVPWVNKFFFYVFNTNAVRSAIYNSGSGVKVRHTSPKKIGEIIIAFPTSKEKQIKIVQKIQNVSTETKRLEAIYQQKIAALDELKKSILQKAFEGGL